MNSRISVVRSSLGKDQLAAQAAEHPEIEYFILQGNDGFAGVSTRGNAPVTDVCVLTAGMTLLDSLERMHRCGSAVAVVSKTGNRDPDAILGILTNKQLADALAESIEHYDDAA
jgi:hypothetical protein